MTDEKNIRLFREIKSLIKKWEYSAPVNIEIKFMFFIVGIALVPGGLLLHYYPIAGFLFIFSTAVLFIFKSRQFHPKRKEVWSNKLDEALTDYAPANESAWRHLQERVREEGLSPEALHQWVERETSTISPANKPNWKFLNDNPNGNNRTGGVNEK